MTEPTGAETPAQEAERLLDHILSHTGGPLWNRQEHVARLTALLKAEAENASLLASLKGLREELERLQGAARTPPRPEDLVGALQDRIHPSSGRLRAARSVNRHRRS